MKIYNEGNFGIKYNSFKLNIEPDKKNFCKPGNATCTFKYTMIIKTVINL